MRLTLGIDIGSSSVKVAIFDVDSGKTLVSQNYPEEEMSITSPQNGWAEQDPNLWWEATLKAFQKAKKKQPFDPKNILSIGISYQMHGLVLLDKDGKLLRPSIIWCDSRAVSIGDKAFEHLGKDYCMGHLLNSPGNFTASKLRWVKENEPHLFEKVKHFLLPGDYINYRLSGEMNTTDSGLSEGIFFDLKNDTISTPLLEYFEFSSDIVPDIVPTFGVQGKVTQQVAPSFGISPGTPITYRAGDQLNNAFSLNVLEPGEVAATGGTSGVVYGVTEKLVSDKFSRVNIFKHLNPSDANKRRLGILLCINGTGILNAWLKRNLGVTLTYEDMNGLAASVPIGAEGLRCFPFGNGAERVLQNRSIHASIEHLNFNIHHKAHILRAAQEGIVYAMKYGFDILNDLGIANNTVKAGNANMFLSPVFKEAFVNTIDTTLKLYNTDGSEGAARGAALGKRLYHNREETFESLTCLETITPHTEKKMRYQEHYAIWKQCIEKKLNQHSQKQ